MNARGRAALLLVGLAALLAALAALARAWPAAAPAGDGGDARARVEAVMAAHGSRLTRAQWVRGGGGGPGGRAAAAAAPPPPPPLFFLTAARVRGGVARPDLEAQRAEQYATNVGGILALGYQVFLAVSPDGAAGGGGGGAWPLVEALAAAAAPGQLRVHYCSADTRVVQRAGGPDETLCMQEAIAALFAGCVVPAEPFALVAPPPPG